MRAHILMSVSVFSLILALGATPLWAQAPDDEYDEIIVTGSSISAGSRLMVTQGGAQDVKFFRTSVIEDDVIPAPGAVTSEGLLSEHNLVIGNHGTCEQLFCITTEAMHANMISRPDQDAFLGVGFATNLTTETWERDPLTIIAVVDTSGSMSGEPLDLVRGTLKMVTEQLRNGDRIGIVEYGNDAIIFMPVTDIVDDKAAIFSRISELDSTGVTNMEAGLRVGFDTAFTAQNGFEGTTRVILFTDEQPNVGATDDASFIGMAQNASKQGIGMTTIGVASHFGADLANKLSAARGGNLFYINSEADIAGQFGMDFELAMTELAQDLTLVIKPARGMKVAEVYGVPGSEINYGAKGSVSLTVPSVFLSSKGGGIFIGLDGDVVGDTSLADVSISYTETKSGQRGAHKTTAKISAAPGQGLMRAQLLSDEFGVLQAVAEANMFGTDLTAALALSKAMESKLIAQDDQNLRDEIELVGTVTELLEERIENGEADSRIANGSCDYCQLTMPPALAGNWTVAKVRQGGRGVSARPDINIEAGDQIAFHLDGIDYDETFMFNLKRKSPDWGDPAFEIESMEINEARKTVKLFDSDIVFDYTERKNELILKPQGVDITLYLTRGGS